MTGIELYSTTAANNNSAVPNGWPEGMAPSGVNDAARQMMAAIRTWYETAEWVNFGDTPTYVSGTSFTVATDLRTRYQIGRRIRLVGTTPFTLYATISNSTYSAPDTTVTLTMDSGTIDATISAVSVSINSVTNKSISSSMISGNLTAILATIANEATDTTCFPLFVTAATGDLALKSNTALTFDSNTANLSCTTFTGAFAGNATTATTATNIATATEATDTTCFPIFVTASGTQTLPGKTNTGLTFNSNTGAFGATSFAGSGSALTGLPFAYQYAVSDEITALTAGTGKLTFRAPHAMTLTGVRASVGTAPTGASLLTIDINESGTTILSTKITIDASEKTSTTAATPPVISDTSIADDAEITVDIDQIGSTIAGAGLKITLIGTRA